VSILLGLRLVGHLRGGYHVTQVDGVDPGVSDTNVNDDFPRSVCGGMEGWLRKGLSRGERGRRSN
jgi:hypothetical protein